MALVFIEGKYADFTINGCDHMIHSHCVAKQFMTTLITDYECSKRVG